MSFHPNMQTTIEGISVIGGLKWCAWQGAIADHWRVTCATDAHGAYVSQAPRLVVILDKRGRGTLDLSLPEARGAAAEVGGGDLHFVPAGVPVRSRSIGLHGLSHVDIHFDLPTLAARVSHDIDERVLATPRLGFCDPRLSCLARLIAAECTDAGAGGDLYGDGLIAATVGALLDGAPAESGRKGRLTPLQLRRVTDYIDHNCLRAVRLQELAEVAGLSQSHFCAAFKATTGMTPYKWHMRARIDRVKTMLEQRRVALADAAAATGFADQAHLTRVFRQVVGVTPGAWLRDQDS